MPSGRLVCRCHDVFLWGYVCFVLLRFRLYYAFFVEAAAVRSIVLRYASAPIATRVFFYLFIFFFLWRYRFFRVFFVPFPLSLCMESTYYVLSFRMVFFYLVTTGWIFYISLCKNSINQSINQHRLRYIVSVLFLLFVWCPCMAINVSVQYNAVGFPDIIMLTQCYYYHRGTRLNATKRFCLCSL